jgi:hypothetical protein
VAAKNVNGRESALSYELVTDAPLPHSVTPVQIFDVDGDWPHLAGFDFSALEAGRVDPTTQDTTADILVRFADDVPYVETVPSSVHIQDFGVCTDGSGDIIFECVGWAPADGYSSTGVLELIEGHIYVVEIVDYQAATTNYAKFGVTQIQTQSVQIIWAYQTIAGLPELSAPDDPGDDETGPVVYEF